MTAPVVVTEFSTAELTRLTRQRRELGQNVADLREDFAAQQNAVRQQAQGLADLNDHGAERAATEARQKLKGVALRLSEAEQALKQFCAAHPTQGELESQLATRQRAGEQAARAAARKAFVAAHATVIGLLLEVELRSAELDQMRKAAPAGTFRLPVMVEELCRPLALWSTYRTSPGGSPISAIRNSVSQI
jgi:DNA polymerase III alpha subunit